MITLKATNDNRTEDQRQFELLQREAVEKYKRFLATGREAKKLGVKQLHRANESGAAFLQLRECYWKTQQGGKQIGWKEYVSSNPTLFGVTYRITTDHIKVHLNWNLIVSKGWHHVVTYRQMIKHTLPAWGRGAVINDEGYEMTTKDKVKEAYAELKMQNELTVKESYAELKVQNELSASAARVAEAKYVIHLEVARDQAVELAKTAKLETEAAKLETETVKLETEQALTYAESKENLYKTVVTDLNKKLAKYKAKYGELT